MLCVAAPPSDHEWKIHCFLPLVCGDGAVIVLVDPRITVLVKGTLWDVPLNVKLIPPGLALSVRATVRGSSRSDAVAVSPPESSAVTSSP